MLNGIDVLERDEFGLLRGCQVGLVTNQTGVTKDGRLTADVMHAAESFDLHVLFSPEHGIRSHLEETAGDTTDEKTGLPVYALYGERTAPSEEQLAEIDTLVFDIQDIGTRFYTYISTLGKCIEAAAKHGTRMVVLDRANPVGGVKVEGPVADADLISFTAFHTLPVRHGMTVGELTVLYNNEKQLGYNLAVVSCDGWRRGSWFGADELPWINPSPNMRSLRAATLYPGIGLLEQTNISVGRGTDTPFEVLGAPFIDSKALAEALKEHALPGLQFEPLSFTPAASTFSGEACNGINLMVTDRDAFDSVRTGLTIATTLRKLYPEAWETAKLSTLLANTATFDALVAGASYDELAAGWQEKHNEFLERRSMVLRYYE